MAGELVPHVLVDSGSGLVLVAKRVARRQGLSYERTKSVAITTAAGRSLVLGRVHNDVPVVYCAGTPQAFVTRLPAFIVEDAGAEAYDVLLGMPALFPQQFTLSTVAGDEHLLLRPHGHHENVRLPVTVRWPVLHKSPATSGHVAALTDIPLVGGNAGVLTTNDELPPAGGGSRSP